MTHPALIIIDCIILTAYCVILFCIVSQFERYRHAGLLFLIIYEFLFWLIDWKCTYNESMTGPNTEIDIALIVSSIDIIVMLVFFAVFMKGNPFINYCLYIITDLFNIIMLFFSLKLRELFAPALPPIGLATNLSDWPVLIFEALAYGSTILIAILFIPRLKKLLYKLPGKLLLIIVFFYLILNFFILAIMIFNAKELSQSFIILSIVILLIFIIALVLFFLSIKMYHAEKLQNVLISQELTRHHKYYYSIHETCIKLHHLKHDLVNHQNIMKLSSNIDEEALKKYRRQLLSQCTEITNEMKKNNSERI